MTLKHIMLILLIFSFFTTFLIYNNNFRDLSSPVKVAGYYFKLLNNEEWFLTYGLYRRDCFIPSNVFLDVTDYKLSRLKHVDINPVKQNDNTAEVEFNILRDDNKRIAGTLSFEKHASAWLITNIKYTREDEK